MRIEFRHIDIEGFMSIGKASIDLTDNGLVLVSGINTNPSDNSQSNGSGKSSIFEAIFYAATGYTIRGSKDIVNRNYPLGCKLELVIGRGDDEFKIIRSRNHHELGTRVMLLMNDEDISGKNMKDCDAVIKQYIPEISWNIISSIVILGQGLPNKLTSYSPSGRKQLLEDLSQTSHLLEEIRGRVDSRKYLLDSKLKEITSKISSLNVESATLQKVISDIRKTMDYTVDEIDTDIYKYINELNQEIDKQSQVKSSEDFFINELLKCNKQHGELYALKSKYNYEISNLQSKIKKLSNNICPTCGRPFDNSNEMLAEVEECKKNLDEVLANSKVVDESMKQLDQKISDYTMAKSEVSSERSKIDSNIINLNSKLERLSNDKSVLLNAQATVDKHTARVNEISEEIDQLNPEKDSINLSLTSLGYIDRSLSKEFKSYILESVIQYLNNKITKYSKYLFTEGYIKFVSSGNSLDVVVGDKSYESLSGGERQKADLCVQLALRDMLVNITGFNCNMIVLDEVFDNLDETGCNNLLKILSDLFVDIDSVYVITHHSDIPIPKDKEFIVTKDYTNLSQIEVKVY